MKDAETKLNPFTLGFQTQVELDPTTATAKHPGIRLPLVKKAILPEANPVVLAVIETLLRADPLDGENPMVTEVLPFKVVNDLKLLTAEFE